MSELLLQSWGGGGGGGAISLMAASRVGSGKRPSEVTRWPR